MEPSNKESPADIFKRKITGEKTRLVDLFSRHNLEIKEMFSHIIDPGLLDEWSKKPQHQAIESLVTYIADNETEVERFITALGQAKVSDAFTIIETAAKESGVYSSDKANRLSLPVQKTG